MAEPESLNCRDLKKVFGICLRVLAKYIIDQSCSIRFNEQLFTDKLLLILFRGKDELNENIPILFEVLKIDIKFCFRPFLVTASIFLLNTREELLHHQQLSMGYNMVLGYSVPLFEMML